MTYQNLVLNSKRKSSITAPAPLTTKLILKQARLTLRRTFLFFLKYGLNFVSRLNVFCFNLPILEWSFAKRFDKKLGNSPGVCQYPAPGQRKICKCPTPGTEKAGKCPAVARGRGGWAQLELTDVLIFNDRFSTVLLQGVLLVRISSNVPLLVQRWSIESTPSKSQLR